MDMALGFRKSLFGYNTEDVAEYINRQSVKHAEVQTELNAKIKENEKQLSSIKEALNLANEENAKISDELSFYKEKYEEVKTLSDNIGKLYLVAQTNAKAIMNAANEAKDATDNEIQQNITAIDAANQELNELKQKIENLCQSFSTDVDKINETLASTRAIIEKSASKQEENTSDFEKVYANL